MAGGSHYPPILRAYEQYLAERVRLGQIQQDSMATRLRRANRLFEAVLRELPDHELERVHSRWFAEHGAGTVISELRTILAGRPRG